MRICSGEFEAGMSVYHVQGGKDVRLSQPQQMMASERKMIDKLTAVISSEYSIREFSLSEIHLQLQKRSLLTKESQLSHRNTLHVSVRLIR